MTKLPVYYGKSGNQPTIPGTNEKLYAVVDDDIAEVLNKFNWFLSDVRRPRPPRTTIYLAGQPFHVLLNRLVYFLNTRPPTERMGWTREENAHQLVIEVSRLPRINTGSNPYDCRLESLNAVLTMRSRLRRMSEEQLSLDAAIPPGLLSITPSTLAEYVEVDNQRLEDPSPVLPPEPPSTFFPSEPSALELFKKESENPGETPPSA